jgi:hypothetical protein
MYLTTAPQSRRLRAFDYRRYFYRIFPKRIKVAIVPFHLEEKGLNRKLLHAGSMILVLSLISMLTASVMAERPNRLLFDLHVTGSGFLYWGAAVIAPEFGFGELEYFTFFDGGVLNFAGSGLAAEVESGYPPPFPPYAYILQEGSVHAAGHLLVKWAYGENNYELNLMLSSTEETVGSYIPLPDPIPPPTEDNPHGFVGSSFGVGFNPDKDFPENMDPQYATLRYRGWYIVDNVRQKIAGKAWLSVGFFTNHPDYPWPKIWRSAGLALRIGDTYATIGFAELQNIQYRRQDGEWIPITIPAARVFRFLVKVI